jgi:hypothetical protein
LPSDMLRSETEKMGPSLNFSVPKSRSLAKYKNNAQFHFGQLSWKKKIHHCDIHVNVKLSYEILVTAHKH